MSFFKRFIKSEPIESMETSTPEITEFPGTIAVSDNEILVTDPVNSKQFATLIIPQDERLTVLIDGTPHTGEVAVHAGMAFSVEIQDAIIEEPGLLLMPVVSADRLTVRLKKEMSKGERLQLANQLPQPTLELSIVQQAFDALPVSLSYAESLLDTYTGERDTEAIQRVIEAADSHEEVVLTGIPAIETIPSYYQQIAEIEEINFVQRGEILAELQPEVPGTPGVDVYGDALPFEVEASLPTLQEGIEEKQGMLFAARDGRLVFSDTEIDVYPQLIIPRDLNEEDGEIIFEDGDILIKGSILEKCFIKSRGRVVVEGGVHHSTIFTQHGTEIKGNVSKSTIYSGWRLFYKHQVATAQSALSNLSATYEQVSAKYEDDRDRKEEMINTLVKEKYDEFMAAVQALARFQVPYTKRFNQPFLELLHYFQEHWHNKRLSLNVTRIEEGFAQLDRYIAFLDELPWDEPAPVSTFSISASNIYATGDITVNGAGAYLSDLISGTKVVVKEKLTGGTVVAEKSVEAGEYRSYNTVDYFIQTLAEDSFIKIGLRNPDSLLLAAEFKHINYDTHKNVNFSAKEERRKQLEQEKRERMRRAEKNNQ